jgi:hypothetical protein
MACGGEMILMKVIEDETMAVSGFERRSFMCSECYDTEQRIAFNKRDRERDSETVPVLTEELIAPKAPPVAPASKVQNQRAAGPGFLRGVLAKIRG